MDIKDQALYLFALRIFTECTVRIAAPVVIFVLFAQWIIGRFGFGWWVNAVAFLLGACITAVDLRKKARQWGREYESLVNIQK